MRLADLFSEPHGTSAHVSVVVVARFAALANQRVIVARRIDDRWRWAHAIMSEPTPRYVELEDLDDISSWSLHTIASVTIALRDHRSHPSVRLELTAYPATRRADHAMLALQKRGASTLRIVLPATAVTGFHHVVGASNGRS